MFPPYCGGPCTLLPNSYVKSAFDVAKNTNPGDLHDEDVLLTGIIRVTSGAPEPTKATKDKPYSLIATIITFPTKNASYRYDLYSMIL